ncbi:tRNA lysidine(34) synthetase TilS [Candidatus Pantoea edessiphila]|uniref:tRNA(Ile)-lysidine synthase n=1 Tax=Candidatus Pantoea edessiphila TaxID=2044610 RepID=A0A2P5T292_9GAMM|nr:tRNA lysidine(34) synthetase TilS [Candidatus Pantoea edessiphila]PPI88686.1 tRNA lysidine(34) synthetase TilS [Candidatus Pantoea edessiphila]
MFFNKVDSLLYNNSRVVIAFSGGLDSTALLHYLSIWHKVHPQSNLRAIHINHGLNINANSWASHCRKLCLKWKINCSILKIKIKNTNKKGIEATARKERYKALISSLYPEEILLTAHHLDDQCETFLLAIKRGSGPLGLGAIYPLIIIGNNKILRPFLEYPRKLIKSYAKKYHLNWIEDESNYNIDFDRNFLRNLILPKIIAKWPNFIETTTRTSLLCRKQELLIDELLLDQLENLISKDGSLYFLPLLKMSDIKVYALLRRWIAKQGSLMPSYNKLKVIYYEIILSRKDAQPRLKLGSYEIRRFRNYLYILPINKSLKNITINWKNLNTELVLPQNLGLLKANYNNKLIRLPIYNEYVTIQFYANGSCHLVGRKNKYKIKKIWQEFNIPPWNRHRIPLIYYNQILICAVNLFITVDGTVLNDNNGWQVIWDQNKDKHNQTEKYSYINKDC